MFKVRLFFELSVSDSVFLEKTIVLPFAPFPELELELAAPANCTIFDSFRVDNCEYNTVMGEFYCEVVRVKSSLQHEMKEFVDRGWTVAS